MKNELTFINVTTVKYLWPNIIDTTIKKLLE